MSTSRWSWLLPLCLAACAPLFAGCPNGDDDDDSVAVPVLDPEPAGAPDEVGDGLDPDGRSTLGCAGNNAPDPPGGSTLTLPGWVRTFADPSNDADLQPAGQGQAFDESGTMVGAAFSDTSNGRIAISVPIRDTGFVGTILVTADGYLDQRFASSRPVTGTAAAGWTWLVTQDEVDTLATEAGVEADPAKGIVVGAVHDCDVFGVANAVVRVAGSTEGIVYFDDFAAAPERTFTADSGRFAIANVDPGTVVVEAYARSEAGGPLELLSRADVQVTAGKVTAVDLEPRIGATQ